MKYLYLVILFLYPATSLATDKTPNHLLYAVDVINNSKTNKAIVDKLYISPKSRKTVYKYLGSELNNKPPKVSSRNHGLEVEINKRVIRLEAIDLNQHIYKINIHLIL